MKQRIHFLGKLGQEPIIIRLQHKKQAGLLEYVSIRYKTI